MERSGAELNQQLGLGRGTHFCLGAPFARVASRVAMETLAERLPDLRLADPEMDLELNPSLFVVAIQHLDVLWGAPQPAAASARIDGASSTARIVRRPDLHSGRQGTRERGRH